jgi:epoxyqueuosine reductase
MDDITIRFSYFIEENDAHAIPTGSIEPCNYDKELAKFVGLISLKHAAYQAGIGVIGKNTLLLTPEYGNMVWLGAVITSLKLEPDRIQTQNPCPQQCKVCIDSCPVGAIDGSLFMDQKRCRNFAFGKEDGGEWRIKCFQCRSRCPYSKGYT